MTNQTGSMKNEEASKRKPVAIGHPHATEAEVQLILAEAKIPRAKCFIKILLYTGLRISEVLQLTASDVHRMGLD
ncbi:MAG: tyrosine-type recombinase/integrase [Dehalococcoidales bacterium]|nr:tyrosine-type recombinase/integrase [Dehalococcoidales bacterium]